MTDPFDEWLNEKESYSLRYERFLSDFPDNHPQVKKWLRAAFKAGRTYERSYWE